MTILQSINQKLGVHKLSKMNRYQLSVILLDITHVADKVITKNIHYLQSVKNIHFNALKRKEYRAILLGYPLKCDYQTKTLRIQSSKLYYKSQILAHKLFKKSQRSLIRTILNRYEYFYLSKNAIQPHKYFKYLQKLNYDKYQLLYASLSATSQWHSWEIINYIEKYYDKLSNYSQLIIKFTDSKSRNFNWSFIFKIALYLENFKLEKNFYPFKHGNQKQRIQEAITYIKHNKFIKYNQTVKNAIDEFYQGVSYGFQFEDLLISKDAHTKVLIMRKVQLDTTPKRCPCCFHLAHKSNSYPRILEKSFECSNPFCIARSKSGRGKRFTLSNAKAQIMILLNNKNDKIPVSIYRAFHRDIINSNYLTLNNLIRLNSYHGDNILILTTSKLKDEKSNGRFLNFHLIKHKTNIINHNCHDVLADLPITKFLKIIYQNIDLKAQSINSKNITKFPKTYLINDNSINVNAYKNKLHCNISSAITSPPYYNARKYSHWSNFLCYLISMLVNAKSVYEALNKNGMYLYNVGDISSYDYTYIHSTMSKRKLMLGAYSYLLLKIAKFNLQNDWIWDKGEVQSFRNTPKALLSGYVKPINCYEHILILSKSTQNQHVKNNIVQIPPVKKINSKKQNTFGHSAPYPIKLAKLVLPFSKPNQYILDPFIGSGTTSVMAKHYGYKSIGFELKTKYYQLAKKRLEKN